MTVSLYYSVGFVRLGWSDPILDPFNNIGPILAMILRQKRIDNGLSVRDVASRLGQSSPNSYGRYETGKSIPTIEKFDELLAAIDPGLSSILRVA